MIVSLMEPLPVHVAYLTAWVNKDGTAHFRNDVYGRDAILAEALLGPRARGGLTAPPPSKPEQTGARDLHSR